MAEAKPRIVTPRSLANMVAKAYKGKKGVSGGDDIRLKASKSQAKAFMNDMSSAGWTQKKSNNDSGYITMTAADGIEALVDLKTGWIIIPKNVGSTNYRPIQDSTDEAYTKFDDKEYEEIEFPKTLLRRVAKMTDNNDHNSARVEIAKQLKKDGNRSGAGYLKTYQAFEKMQKMKGEMSQSQINQRYAFDKSMKDELVRTYSNADDVWMAL